jgi:hypothetical protein
VNNTADLNDDSEWSTIILKRASVQLLLSEAIRSATIGRFDLGWFGCNKVHREGGFVNDRIVEAELKADARFKVRLHIELSR